MMTVRSQVESIAQLIDSASHGSGEPVEQIETHISRIFLSGDRAYKMKRSVLFPYVDFSTPELRLSACRKEVELNSMTAPGLYLSVRRITREADGKLAFDGDGKLLDAVIEMVRSASQPVISWRWPAPDARLDDGSLDDRPFSSRRTRTT